MILPFNLAFNNYQFTFTGIAQQFKNAAGELENAFSYKEASDA